MSRRTWSLILFCPVLLAVCLLPVVHADPDGTLDAQQVYQLAKPAVVYIRALRADGSLQATGSGFLLDAEGTILTAHHVVDRAVKFECVIGEPQIAHPCEVAGKSKSSDAAMLRLIRDPSARQKLADSAYLRLRSSPVQAGEPLYAMGFPIKNTLIITNGIAASSSVSVQGASRAMITAPIVKGMSGGPLLDQRGEVVGLASASYGLNSGVYLMVETRQWKQAFRINP